MTMDGAVVKTPSARAGGARDAGLIPAGGDPLEEGMATHSSVLAWRIPGTEEPGGLHAIESQRVRHDGASEHTTRTQRGQESSLLTAV